MSQTSYNNSMTTTQLIHSDNLAYLQQQSSEIYDMVLTSPPYNINIPYDQYSDNKSVTDYCTHVESVLTESFRCLKTGGRIAVNVMPNSQLNLPTHSRITALLERLGAVWITEIIWDKGGVNRWFPRGTYGSAVKPWFQHSFEYVVVLGKGTTRREAPCKGDLTNKEYTEWTTPLWRLRPEQQMKSLGHPAVFPQPLVMRLLKLFSWPGDHVVDPWGGTGTTALVAQQLNRSATSIEQSLQYHQTAQARVNKETVWQDLFETSESNTQPIDKLFD